MADDSASAAPAPSTDDTPRVSRVGCLSVVGGGLAVATLLGAIFVLPTYRAQSWREAACTIDYARILEHVDDEGYKHYTLSLRYTYAVYGKPYTSDRYTFFDTTSDAEKQTLVTRLTPGSRVTCYYDPADPREAVLARDYIISGWLLLLVGLPVLIIMVWVGFYLRQQRREAARPARERWRIDALPAGSLRLSPRRGHAARILLAVTSAVVLTSITILLARVLPRPVDGPLWQLLLQLPYLVGALAGGAILSVPYSLLRAIGPRLRLVVAADRVRLGGTVALHWELGGVATAVRSLTVVLEGREERDRKVHCFSTTELKRFEASAFLPGGGAIDLALPADTMHSFDQPGYRVAWLVRIRADVARWPDFDEAFELTVLPQEVPR